MRTIFTITNLVRTSMFGFALLAIQPAFSQTSSPTCQNVSFVAAGGCTTPVTYTFENLVPGGDLDGFSGDFEYGGPNSPNANSSVYLKSTLPFGTPKILTTAGFVTTTPAQEIDYTFTIGGNATVTSFDVDLVDGAGNFVMDLCTGIVPVYQGSSTTTVCITSVLAGQPAGSYKLRFTFNVSQSGGSPNAYITFDDFGLLSGGNAIVLPVNFKSLVIRKATTGANLIWEVSDEMNVLHYEIERSTDGRNFTKIGTVAASKSTSYSFVDTKQSAGVVYYRIRSVDGDGKYKFSTVVSYSNGRSVVILKAFPLPAQNTLTVQHEPILGKGQITISAQDGRIMKMVSPAAGSTQTVVDLSNLSRGMYLLQFANGDGQLQTLKVVKQ